MHNRCRRVGNRRSTIKSIRHLSGYFLIVSLSAKAGSTILPPPSFKLLRDYVLSLEAIRYGIDPSDKLMIFLNRILHAGFPLSNMWYRQFGRPIISPPSLVSGYKCQYGGLVFRCPGGNSEIQFLRRWESDVKKAIVTRKKGDAIDVGANFGLYTMMLSHTSDLQSRILSIEPDPVYFHWLGKNIGLNKCRNVTALNIAAWNTNARLRLDRHLFGALMISSSVSIGEECESGTIARPLDQVFDELDLRPRFAKIDVEGAEYQVLQGMKKTIELERPMLVIETHDDETRGRCKAFLEKFEYVITDIHYGNFLASQLLAHD